MRNIPLSVHFLCVTPCISSVNVCVRAQIIAVMLGYLHTYMDTCIHLLLFPFCCTDVCIIFLSHARICTHLTHIHSSGVDCSVYYFSSHARICTHLTHIHSSGVDYRVDCVCVSNVYVFYFCLTYTVNSSAHTYPPQKKL